MNKGYVDDVDASKSEEHKTKTEGRFWIENGEILGKERSRTIGFNTREFSLSSWVRLYAMWRFTLEKEMEGFNQRWNE